jgi:hypothetical protein
MKNLELSEEEAAVLLKRLIDDDGFLISRRVRTLKAIRAKLRPESVRAPRPPPKYYEPPRAKAARGGALVGSG